MWVIACFLKSPGLFSVFWLTLIMMLFGWSLLVFFFQNLPALRGFFQVLQLKLASPSPLCFIVFFSSLARSKYLSLFSISFHFILCFAGTAKSLIRQVFSSLLMILLSLVVVVIIFGSISHQLYRWFFNGFWETASSIRSPGFFSVFQPILTMLRFRSLLLVLLFSSSPVPLSVLWWLI